MLSFGQFIEEVKKDPTIVEGYFRYRRAVNILPGVKANITNTGLSGITIGKKGKKALVSINRRGFRRSFSLKKGLSFIAASSGKKRSSIVKAKKVRPAKNIH